MPVSQVREAFVEDFAGALVASGDVECEGADSGVASVVVVAAAAAAVVVVVVSGMRVLAATSLIRIFMPTTPVPINRQPLLLD